MRFDCYFYPHHHLGHHKEDVALLAVNASLPLELQQAVAPLDRLVVIHEQDSGNTTEISKLAQSINLRCVESKVHHHCKILLVDSKNPKSLTGHCDGHRVCS